MNSSSIIRSFCSVTVVAAACVTSSCSLPPKEAWIQMRREGLIPFIANGMTAPKAITGEASGAQLAKNSPAKKAAPSDVKVAYPVEGLLGYVRTPYTSPTRLVNVAGAKSGGQVMCPYTQKPFIVPTAAVVLSRQVAAVKAPPPPVRQAPIRPSTTQYAADTAIAETSPSPAPVPPRVIAPAPAKPSVASAPPKPIPARQKQAEVKPQPKPQPKPEPSVAKKDVVPAPVAKLPFGSPIPGRPGFVNSPYAERHQLVDVTGLAVGTEVKCPYTGKSFRVPPQNQAKR